jgi:hypothetical protein
MKGVMDISPYYPHYTARRTYFAKRFPKTNSAPSQNPLHQHSHSHSHSPAKRTLNSSDTSQLADSAVQLCKCIY